MKLVAGSYKLELSQLEVLKQSSGCPINSSDQQPILSLGNQNILISLPMKEVQQLSISI